MKHLIRRAGAFLTGVLLCGGLTACAPREPGPSAAAPTGTGTSAPETVTIHGRTWRPTLLEEFDGTALDWDLWEPCPNWRRDDCTWTDDAAALDGQGHLVLRITGDEVPFAAGAVRTRTQGGSILFEQAYGYFEARMKLPAIDGICAAFWLMCDGAGTVGTPGGGDGTEIDIIEATGMSPGKAQHALHWDGYGDEHQSAEHPMTGRSELYDGEYHTFALAWTPEEYVFYIDGAESWRTAAGGVCAVPAYLKLTVSTGAWVGTVDPTQLPTDALVVDYVHVYEAAESAG